MTTVYRLVSVAVLLCAANAWGQTSARGPHIGYVFPAGGQVGSVVQIMVGGQNLRDVQEVYVTGEGVQASEIQYVGRLRLKADQARELSKQIARLWKRKPGEVAAAVAAMDEGSESKDGDGVEEVKPKVAALPKHPLIQNLETKSRRELAFLRKEQRNFRKRQANSQIAETVLLEIQVDSDAAPGDREIRLRTKSGLTNPMRFQVGLLPEINETELNDPGVQFALPKMEVADLPVLLNGQVTARDVDRFRFRAYRGQRLVIEAQARSLIPYLADAVPGWFQATMAIFDAQGNEVAFADDYRFSPDPVLFWEVPKDGVYELEVRDSIYRGREDFVYRVAISEQPFVTSVFPLGTRAGKETKATIGGWNLSKRLLPLEASGAGEAIRYTSVEQKDRISNAVQYAVGSLPERREREPNDTMEEAQRVTLPLIVNGRISAPGDVDVFQFKGDAGGEVVAEVYGRRLSSPIDSLLRLKDASGKVLEWNDDYMVKDGHLHRGMGSLTHHADSYLRAVLPLDGSYCVEVGDSQHQGTKAHGYRLRISPPRPSFALRVTPSSLIIPTGRAAALTVYVSREDDFDGEVELVLKDAPEGFTLGGSTIPAGRDRVRVTLTAPREPIKKPVALRLEGRAQVGSRNMVIPVEPAEDVMQAFLYRHLAPSQELIAVVTGKPYRGRPTVLAQKGPVRIPEGGTTKVTFGAPRFPRSGELQLALSAAPKGLTLDNVQFVPKGVTFQLSADEDLEEAVPSDNLIVEAFIEREFKGRKGKGKKRKQRISLGVLPAIPFEIVRQ